MLTNTFNCNTVKQHRSNQARIAKINTPHGEVLTPAFMPVGTRAFINHMTPDELITTKSQIILGGNTYHMLCSPGLEVLQATGGMHKFMSWHGPMLTDSGGFQVFSLSQNKKICKIDDFGAHFKHPETGRIIELNPTISIEAQRIIGADIIMAFDECTPEDGGRERALAAIERTHRWLIQSKEVYEKNPYSAYGFRQALFGIIQGGSFRDLREKSAQFVIDLNLDGIALGGEAIGFDMEKTIAIMQWVLPLLPHNKIRYAMGVGLNPQDLIDVVAEGFDIFDCVAPTRNARHGALYSGRIVTNADWLSFESEENNSRILIKRGVYEKDERPIMDDCSCYTCQNFSRAYLHYLFKRNATLYGNLACIHNVHVMQAVCAKMREIIATA